MTHNLVDQCGGKVTVWCEDGNSMESRTLFTIDSFGVVVSPYSGSHVVFVPWCKIKYIDYDVEE